MAGALPVANGLEVVAYHHRSPPRSGRHRGLSCGSWVCDQRPWWKEPRMATDHTDLSRNWQQSRLLRTNTQYAAFIFIRRLFSHRLLLAVPALDAGSMCASARGRGTAPTAQPSSSSSGRIFPHGVVRAWRALGAGLRTCLTRSTNWKRTSAYWRLASHRHGLDSTPSPLQLLPAFRSSTTLLTAHCSRSPLKSCRRHSFGTRRVAETKTVPPLTKKRSAPNIPSLPLLIVHGLLSR